MRKAARILHILHRIALDLHILGILLEDINQLAIRRVRANAVNYREGEFSLGEILAEPFILRVHSTRKVEVIIADLEYQTHDIHQGNAVFPRRTLRLHQFHREPKEPARFIADHFQVLVFRRAGQRVAPKQIHPLAPVQVQHLLYVDVDCGRVVELLNFLQREEVHVICGVDCLRCSEDVVRDGDAAAEDGVVFDVIDSGVTPSASDMDRV